jgi:hypothetical protein
MPSRVDLSRLPRTDEHFVGRLQELVLLDDAWTTGKNVVSIVAWGGVGKTALVRHWLGRLAGLPSSSARSGRCSSSTVSSPFSTHPTPSRPDASRIRPSPRCSPRSLTTTTGSAW